MFRRVGPRQRGPPAAGGRRLAVPARQSGTETPDPWGNLQLGEVPDTSSVDLRCRWPSLAGQGPTHRSAPTRRWRSLVLPVGADLRVRPLERPFTGPWSGSGFRSRDHSMTTPVFSRTGHAGQGRSKHVARREPAEGRRVWSAPARKTPSARRATAPERNKAVFSLDRARPVSLLARQKRNGGCGPLSGPDKFPRRNRRNEARRCRSSDHWSWYSLQVHFFHFRAAAAGAQVVAADLGDPSGAASSARCRRRPRSPPCPWPPAPA